MKKVALGVCAAMVLAAGGSWAQEAAAPATQPEAAATQGGEMVDQAKWEGILKRLGSEEFAEREAAQKELDKAGMRERSTLRKLLAGVTDEEVKSRVEARLETIEEALVTMPLPISVELKDAALSEVAAALEKETGVKFTSWPDDRMGGRRANRKLYTLSVKEKPFWEVIKALMDQGGFQIQAYDGFRLMQQEPGYRRMNIFGPLVVVPGNIQRSTQVDLQAPEGQELKPETMSLYMTVMLDPRIKAMKWSQPTIYKVEDDAGNVLFEQPRQEKPPFWNQGRQGTWSVSTSLKIPANPGKKIKVIKGDIRGQMVLKATKMTIGDVPKQIKDGPVVFEGRKFTVSQWQPQGTICSFNFNTSAEAENAAIRGLRMAGVAEQPPEMVVRVLDAGGREVWTTTMGTNSGSGGSFGMGEGAKLPLKIELAVPVKVKEVSYEFEIGGMPVP